jgi:hypothetical protein
MPFPIYQPAAKLPAAASPAIPTVNKIPASSGSVRIVRRFAQVFFALAEEGEALGSAKKRGHTRAAAEKIEELKENLQAKIIKAEKHRRSEWRFVMVSIVTVLLGFQAVLSSLKH